MWAEGAPPSLRFSRPPFCRHEAQRFSGQTLQTLHDPNANIEWLTFGVDLRSSGPSIVFLWPNDHAAPARYLDEALSLPSAQLAQFLTQFFFAHCENTYFASAWWERLNETQQYQLELLMANSNPYYYPPRYDLAQQLAPWRVVAQNRQ